MSKRPFHPSFLLLALIFVGLACSRNADGGGGQAATVEALSQSISSTSTAAAAEASPEPTGRVETTEAEATATSNSAATAEAEAALRAQQAQAATATVVAPILAELPTYGVDPSTGRLAWIHPPLTLELDGHRVTDFQNQFPTAVAGDFVLSADITWTTQYGASGCGFMLRGDGNQETPNNYLVIATRAATGHVGFTPIVNGEAPPAEVKDIFANGIDPKFEWQNGSTNRLTVVARGPTFTIYTNGTPIGQITDDKFDRGFVAFAALSDSGRTVCQFGNGWLWLLDQ